MILIYPFCQFYIVQLYLLFFFNEHLNGCLHIFLLSLFTQQNIFHCLQRSKIECVESILGFLLSSHKLMKHVGGWITRYWTRFCLQLACAFGKWYPRSNPLFPQANQTRLNAKGTTYFSWIVYLILLTVLHFVDYPIYCTNLWIDLLLIYCTNLWYKVC